ncbi:MAG: response regulator [Anaerolineae bacterium]|nr:response regulator [Thermoflexus sp.]MDW8064727.1 response regulator [Anaerolineae bacterium]
MSKARILVVEDDPDIANLLKTYFSALHYEVQTVTRGQEALEKTRQQLPHLIILDIILPDIDGYEVCRRLRTNLRTGHIPIIFLTQRDERSDRIAGLELGADDYITKPFDIEELRLRVQNAIRRAERESLNNPVTGLPSGRLIEDQLRALLRRSDWGLLYIGINSLDAFREIYGFVAGDEVLRWTAMLIGEVVDELGTPQDFIGHVGGDDFVVITEAGRAEAIAQALRQRFADGVATHYTFADRERGYLLLTDREGNEKRIPFMTLAIGIVRAGEWILNDIRELTEIAAEARRKEIMLL